MSIREIPRTLIVDGHEFLEKEIHYLKGLFTSLDMIMMDKVKIRKDSVVQKAILSGVCLIDLQQAMGSTAVLSLSQVGRDLLGKV